MNWDYSALPDIDQNDLFRETFRQQMTRYVDDFKAASGMDIAPTPDDFDLVCRREWSFFSKVYGNTMQMAEVHDGPVRVWFDVDYTIRSAEGINGVVRPAYGLLIDALYAQLGDRFQLGLITTLRNTDGQLDRCLEPQHVRHEAVRERAQVISVHDYVKANNLLEATAGEDPDGPEVERRMFAAISDVVDPNITKAFDADEFPLTFIRELDGKLEAILHWLAQHEGESAVVVDDTPYTAMLKRDHPRLRGVHVAPEIQELPVWPARMVVERMLKRVAAVEHLLSAVALR
ncbi:MAG TPA: hypothetical protein VLF69_03625 [Candidatus Saccharimonadales bacterium]|nr:hypothetical protein [Candidatus Saccharimonadales bacterium]